MPRRQSLNKGSGYAPGSALARKREGQSPNQGRSPNFNFNRRRGTAPPHIRRLSRSKGSRNYSRHRQFKVELSTSLYCFYVLAGVTFESLKT